MPKLIDLRKLRDPLAAAIQASLLAFSAQHPKTRICSVGLHGDGFHGTASLHLDTPSNSAAFVKKSIKAGHNRYGEDSCGRFCHSCWDFAHCGIGDYRFPGYPDLYKGKEGTPVDFIA